MIFNSFDQPNLRRDDDGGPTCRLLFFQYIELKQNSTQLSKMQTENELRLGLYPILLIFLDSNARNPHCTKEVNEQVLLPEIDLLRMLRKMIVIFYFP